MSLVFITDDEIFMTQLPPFLDYKHNLWPGVMTAGRFPIDVWPRILSWGFEWVDKKKDLIFKRGDPWFYVFFESHNPNDQIKLIMADNTEELTIQKRNCKKLNLLLIPLVYLKKEKRRPKNF